MFNWSSRIERDLEHIRYILRRDNADTILLNKAADAIEAVLLQLTKDVTEQTNEDIKKEGTPDSGIAFEQLMGGADPGPQSLGCTIDIDIVE